jgi:hypothetical protein
MAPRAVNLFIKKATPRTTEGPKGHIHYKQLGLLDYQYRLLLKETVILFMATVSLSTFISPLLVNFNPSSFSLTALWTALWHSKTLCDETLLFLSRKDKLGSALNAGHGFISHFPFSLLYGQNR